MLVLKTTAQLHFSLSTTEQIVSSVANRITEFVIERQQIYTKPRQKHGICFHSLNKTRLASVRDKPFQRTALLEAKLFRKLVAEGMEQVTSSEQLVEISLRHTVGNLSQGIASGTSPLVCTRIFHRHSSRGDHIFGPYDWSHELNWFHVWDQSQRPTVLQIGQFSSV